MWGIRSGQYIGCISKEFNLLKPGYHIDCNGWHIEGNFFEMDYVIDVHNQEDALCALMLVPAIDAEKCSRN